NTAFIVLTGHGNEETAVSAMRAGALDYLNKNSLTQEALRRAIQNATEKMALRSQLAVKSQQLAERNSALTKRNEEIQRFYQTVCHELRTPLAATREFVSIVADGIAGGVNEEQSDLLRLASEGCDQITALLDDLLDAARMQTGKLTLRRQIVELGPFLRDVEKAFAGPARDHDIALGITLARDDLYVDADPLRLRQVINNLLSNALKFTDAGGEITVTVTPDGPHESWVRFSISDTGCGISSDDQPLIFERLYQAKPRGGDPGRGRGRPNRRDNEQLHGADLELASEVGVGSTFSFSLPAGVARIATPT
ncbi:MAG: hybrid sensor histidine kinase/response regulator, partial [Pseudomonadota bacterium]